MSELTEGNLLPKSNESETHESKLSDTSMISNFTKSHYSSCHNFESLSSPTLDRQIDLVLKDYEKSEINDESTSSIQPFEESSFYCSSNDSMTTDRVDSQLKHIEETAKQSLSKYFEKNVLKFKIKLTFDEPMYLTNDIYLDELSIQESENDIVSIKSNNTEINEEPDHLETEDQLENTMISNSGHSSSSESFKNSKSSMLSQKSNIKIGVVSLEEKKLESIEDDLKTNNLEIFNKLSDLVDMFSSDSLGGNDEGHYDEIKIVDELVTIPENQLPETECILRTPVDETENYSEVLPKNLETDKTVIERLETVNFENSRLLIINNALMSTENDSEMPEMSSKESGGEGMNADIFDFMNSKTLSVNNPLVHTMNDDDIDDEITSKELEIITSHRSLKTHNFHISPPLISSNLTSLKLENFSHLDHTQKSSTSTSSITESTASTAADQKSIAALDQAIDTFINTDDDEDSCEETYEAVRSLIEKETRKAMLVKEADILDECHKKKLNEIIDIFTDGLGEA